MVSEEDPGTNPLRILRNDCIPIEFSFPELKEQDELLRTFSIWNVIPGSVMVRLYNTLRKEKQDNGQSLVALSHFE